MKANLGLAGAVVLLASACGGGSSAEATVDPAESVARLAGTACLKPIFATATVVGEGLALTVAHAVAGAEEDLRLITPEGVEHSVSIVGFDPDRDLALLFAGALEAPALLLGSPTTDQVGEIVTVTRDLAIERIDYRIRRRINTRSANIYDEGTVIRSALDVDAVAAPGASGAALVDEHGAIVGMVFAGARDEESVIFAVDADEIREFLDSVDPTTTVPSGRCR